METDVRGKGKYGCFCNDSEEYIVLTDETTYGELGKYLYHTKSFREFIVILTLFSRDSTFSLFMVFKIVG